MEQKVSPEFIQTSLAASLTLGFQNGSFHRNAELKGLNLLLHYDEGCLEGAISAGFRSPGRKVQREKPSSGWLGLFTLWKKSSKGRKVKTKFIASVSR